MFSAGSDAAPWRNWGLTKTEAYESPEPNQLTGIENCALADYRLSTNRTVQEVGAWGWADAGCSDLHIAICEIPRERPLPLTCAVLAPLCHQPAAATGALAEEPRSACASASP